MQEQTARSPRTYEAERFFDDTADASGARSPGAAAISTPDLRNLPLLSPPLPDSAPEESVAEESAVIEHGLVAPGESGPSEGQEEGGGAGEEMGRVREGGRRENRPEKAGIIEKTPSVLISDLKLTKSGSPIDDTAKWLAQEWASGERAAGLSGRGDSPSAGDEVWLRQ